MAAEEHLDPKILEDAIERLLNKLGKIKNLAQVDVGQAKAPSKQAYKDACLAIRREIG